jgi:hypothetical protein
VKSLDESFDPNGGLLSSTLRALIVFDGNEEEEEGEEQNLFLKI